MSKYSVYIITNPKKRVLYTGITNNLEYRLIEHYLARGENQTFAGRYFCYCLLYYEHHYSVTGAIQREKEIKDWRRERKEDLINSINPNWIFLNEEVTPWPPDPEITTRG